MNNRNKANIILATVFVLFAAATIIKHIFRASLTAEYTAFVLEAALVGGIADWFAVTALFSKPLGFSWHTAIIPRNREKIIDKVAELVEKELIGVDAINGKLSRINPADIVLDKVSSIVNTEFIEQKLSGFMSDKAAKLDTAEISHTVDKLLKDNLRKEGIAIEIRNALLSSVMHGKHLVWLSELVKKAEETVEKPSTRERIYQILTEQEKGSVNSQSNGTSLIIKTILNISNSSEYTNPKAISGILQSELANMLKKMESESDPLFIKFSEKFAAMVENLDDDNSLTSAVQTWKNGVIDQLDLAENLEILITAAVQSQLERNEVSALIANQLVQYRNALKENEALKKMADDVIRSMMEKIITNEHHLIGDVVKESLSAFTNERLNKFVEDTAGEELQWIRINGSIVGAAAGALIFPFANLFYQPYVVPLIQKLFGMH